jgi:AGZA family xanthine/uracil permease-like MFS transporter
MHKDWFQLKENRTSVRVEVLAGVTTFLTMAYIIVVQPQVLSGQMFGIDTGMDFDAVMVATCIAAAVATAIMGLYARYPIAQAPGMGENFFFVLSVLPAAAAISVHAWQVALGVVFIAGVLFLILSIAGVREMLVNSLSTNMKNAMAVGIGLFIAFIGFQNAGLIITSATVTPDGGLSPGTLVKLNPDFASIDLAIFFFGLILTTVLHVRRVRGSILLGILGATLLAVGIKLAVLNIPAVLLIQDKLSPIMNSALMTRMNLADSLLSAPPSLSPTLFKMDLAGALTFSMIPFIMIFLIMDVFDTLGTLIGVGEQAGFIKDNKFPRANKAMVSDAVGTVAGACLGTSTVTSFIESAAGVEQGGRTGLTALVTSFMFLMALFFSPFIRMIGSYPAITAPALVVVGAMMIQNVKKIDWMDYSESVPAFLTLIMIPLTYSIYDGLSMGFISYPIIKLLSGKGRDVSGIMYFLCVLLIVYFVVIRSRI